MRILHASSADEMLAIASERSPRLFARDGGPLWEVSVIETMDGSGYPALSVLALFDHLISDGVSLDLFQQALRGEWRPWERQRPKSYREWVSSQRQQFPMHEDRLSGPCYEFWRRHFDGTGPDRASPISFCLTPEGSLSGIVSTITSDFHMPMESLKAAGKRLKATPFMVVLASVASSVAKLGNATDITLRVTVAGRPVDHRDTQGFFANSLPVRLSHSSLYNSHGALDAVRSVWLKVLFFQTTPKDYLQARFGQSDSIVGRPVQVVVNFIPYEADYLVFESVKASAQPGNMAGIEIDVSLTSQRQCRLEGLFDSGRFSKHKVHEFLDMITGQLAELIGKQ